LGGRPSNPDFLQKDKKEAVQNLDLLNLELWKVFFAKKEKHTKCLIMEGTQYYWLVG
jgi:hypothetical protein